MVSLLMTLTLLTLSLLTVAIYQHLRYSPIFINGLITLPLIFLSSSISILNNRVFTSVLINSLTLKLLHVPNTQLFIPFVPVTLLQGRLYTSIRASVSLKLRSLSRGFNLAIVHVSSSCTMIFICSMASFLSHHPQYLSPIYFSDFLASFLFWNLWSNIWGKFCFSYIQELARHLTY